jgi:predicted enzyme related to lactoylglutathione lyase
MENNDTPPGAPVWIDLLTSDQERAAAFYGELFGWTLEDLDGRDYGGYRNFLLDGVRVAGSMSKQPGMELPDLWSVYLSSPDIKETLDLVEAAGGEVHLDVQEVYELGRFGMDMDAAGASVGIWEPGTHRGFGRIAEPGAPCWFELHTRDIDAASTFYERAFGWPVHVTADEPGFRYRTYGSGDDQRAGIMDASGFLPEGVPAHWSVYFGTADADRTIATAQSLGATLVQGPDDTPYGRLASLTDPTGALFKLVQDL